MKTINDKDRLAVQRVREKMLGSGELTTQRQEDRTDKYARGYRTLPGSDFICPPVPRKQAVALIFGLPAHGKTTLGLLYAPGPVAFFDIDKRGLYAARKAQRAGKIIHYLPVDMPRKMITRSDQELKRLAEKEVSKVMKNAEIVAKESKRGLVRTVVFDTASELGNLLNMSITGRVDKRKDDFGKSTHLVKGLAKTLVEIFRESDANMIMLARAKELWVGHEPTGKYKHEGLDTLEYEADWAGHLRLAKDRKTKLYRAQTHELEVTKAGMNLKQLGAVYTEEQWGEDGPFVYACVQNYRGSKAESWK